MTHRWGMVVDLDRCTTSAEVLDWILQIRHKTWTTDQDVADLVHALDDVLRPQAKLCSWGVERGPIDVKAVVAEYARKASR